MDANTRKRLIKNAIAEYGEEWKYKSPCNSAVVDYFGRLSNCKYLHTIDDVIRTLRCDRYILRSRRSEFPDTCTVSELGKILKKRHEKWQTEYGYYIVQIMGHVLLKKWTGATLVDTDYVEGNDTRRVRGIYILKLR